MHSYYFSFLDTRTSHLVILRRPSGKFDLDIKSLAMIQDDNYI